MLCCVTHWFMLSLRPLEAPCPAVAAALGGGVGGQPRRQQRAMLGPPPTAFSSDPPCVVIDNGSGRIKVGFSGTEVPKAVLPTSGLEGVSDDRRPLAHGIIADWDAMESYWDHAFTNLLDIDTEQVNILIAANMFETKDNREL